ncbi:MAG: isochorismate synthase, partial [Flavobacterium sp.]
MTDLFLKVQIHKEQKLPFVLFCKPDSDRIVGVFQKNDHLYFLENFEEKGFVFAPFDASMIPYFPLEYSHVMVDKVPVSDYFFKSDKAKPKDSFGRDFFTELVSEAVQEIQNHHFSKVVLSRKEEVPLPDFDIELVMKKMIGVYKNAFRYVFYHPKIGTWMG